MKRSLYRRGGKLCFDAVAAGLALVLISPGLLLIALLVKLSSRGPILFSQMRVGMFGRPFRMYKFRSMREGADRYSQLTAAGDPRITPLGSWLRRTKMDELPQLLNVLIAQMSLVGPRPEVPQFASHYTERQRKVLDVRPGMTGPSVIVREEELLAAHEDKEGYYVSTIMPAKLEIDLDYCEKLSLRTDLQILYRTFVTLLTKVDRPFKSFPHLVNRPSKAHASVNEQKKDEVYS